MDELEKKKLFEFRFRAEQEDEQEAQQATATPAAPSQDIDDESAVMEGLKFLGRTIKKGAGYAVQGATDIMDLPATGLREATGRIASSITGRPFERTGETVLGVKKAEMSDVFKTAGLKDEPVAIGWNPALSEQEITELEFGGTARPSTIAGMGYDPTIIAGIPGVKQVLGVAGKGVKAGVKGAGEAIEATARIADIAYGKTRATPIVEGAAQAGRSAKQAIENVAKRISDYFKPTRASDWNEVSRIAKDAGLNVDDLPSSLEFGPSSSVTKTEKTLAEALSGEDLIKKHYDAKVKIDTSVDDQVSALSGGKTLNTTEAGQSIASGYDKALNKMFSDIDVTNRSILQSNPGYTLSNSSSAKIDDALVALENEARRKAGYKKVNMATGEVIDIPGTQIQAQKQQAQNILERINAIRGTKNKAGQYDYDSFLEAVQGMGSDAHAVQGRYNIPIDTAKEQGLYKKLTDIRIDDIEQQLGKEVADKLRENNKKMSEFFKKSEGVKKAALSGKSEEKIYDAIIKGDFRTIQGIKETMPEVLVGVRGTYLDSLISRNPEGLINHGLTRKALNKNREKLSILFNEQELKKIDDLTFLGDRLGSPVMSTSGTGASIGVREGVKDVAKEAALRAQLDQLKERARRNYAEGLTPTQRMMQGIPEPKGLKKIQSVIGQKEGLYKKTRQARATGLKKLSEDEE